MAPTLAKASSIARASLCSIPASSPSIAPPCFISYDGGIISDFKGQITTGWNRFAPPFYAPFARCAPIRASLAFDAFGQLSG